MGVLKRQSSAPEFFEYFAKYSVTELLRAKCYNTQNLLIELSFLEIF
jgi:hypothetical protein